MNSEFYVLFNFLKSILLRFMPFPPLWKFSSLFNVYISGWFVKNNFHDDDCHSS